MKTSDFHFDLPEHLIAQTPPKTRGDSRLLLIDRATGSLEHKLFSDFPSYLSPKDCLVLNDTRVIPARLYGKKTTGAHIEVLLERLTGPNTAWVHIKANRAMKPGASCTFPLGLTATLLERRDDLFLLEFSNLPEPTLLETFERIGHMPLPPYIKREDSTLDAERYQTVYAKEPGAVAAPTAGLHFTPELLDEISGKGVHSAQVTLHVGAGTFQPVKVDNIQEHKMHAEYCTVSQQACDHINATKQAQGRVCAIGTTSVRTLESAATHHLSATQALLPFSDDTRLFITPGYQFKAVDMLCTNFHLPGSTLLMLVSAFMGYDLAMRAYREAVQQEYRFFSYGDAMLIL